MTSQYQLFSELKQDEYARLKESIRQYGVLVPIEYDESGNVLDGHHRLKACLELDKKEFLSIVRTGMTEQEKRNHVRTLNMVRRHLSVGEMESHWIEMRLDGMTYQAIADASGVSEKTIRNSVSENSETQPEYVTGKDGKRYPAKKASVINKNKKDLQRTLSAFEKIGSTDLPVTVMDSKRISYLANKKEREDVRQEMGVAFTDSKPSDQWHIYRADINDWQPSRKYDFIITDPPYPKEYLNLYNVLAEKATQWLKPGGLLVAMCGQSYLDRIHKDLSRHLDYYWTACYLTQEQPTPIRQRNVNSTWKPLLIYKRKDGEYEGKIFGDVFWSDKNEKDLHNWQQSEQGMLSIVKMICLPGQYILDPFCGSGTTGVAALAHGCFFDGIDIDKDNVNISIKRMNDAEKKRQS